MLEMTRQESARIAKIGISTALLRTYSPGSSVVTMYVDPGKVVVIKRVSVDAGTIVVYVSTKLTVNGIADMRSVETTV